jgi:hypothetical protein
LIHIKIKERSIKSLNFKASSGLESLCFVDDLTIFSLDGKKIGKFSIDVTKETFKNEECFHVQAKR